MFGLTDSDKITCMRKVMRSLPLSWGNSLMVYAFGWIHMIFLYELALANRKVKSPSSFTALAESTTWAAASVSFFLVRVLVKHWWLYVVLLNRRHCLSPGKLYTDSMSVGDAQSTNSRWSVSSHQYVCTFLCIPSALRPVHCFSLETW